MEKNWSVKNWLVSKKQDIEGIIYEVTPPMETSEEEGVSICEDEVTIVCSKEEAAGYYKEWSRRLMEEAEAY